MANRVFWSGLFFLVPLLSIACYVMAAAGLWPFNGAWLPEIYSEAGKTIDHLFYVFHYISAVILIVTGLAIGWVVWQFDSKRIEKAQYVHKNLTLEIIWTAIPAGILIFIAFYQMSAWAEHKMNRPVVVIDGVEQPKPPLLLVRAKQFGWEFHYAGEDGLLQTQDDIYIENEMRVPVDEDIVLQLESTDVIHSLFVPELRLKQDIVPGMKQFVWFRANQTAEMEIACTELCGWGHFRMKARLKVVSRGEFDQWLAGLKQATQPSAFQSETAATESSSQ